MMQDICFETITNEFSWGKYGDFKVIVMLKNGYINVTNLCSLVGKRFRSWNENISSIELIEDLSSDLDMPAEKLIIKIAGGNKNQTVTRGSYAHPRLIPHIALWISSKFAIKVSKWLEEWRKYSKENNLSYWKTLSALEPSFSDDEEYRIKLDLATKLNGVLEVQTDVGKIDIMTCDSIIEIKKFDKWKHALGQILAYGESKSNKNKIIYLSDYPNNKNEISKVERILKKYDVAMKLYEQKN